MFEKNHQFFHTEQIGDWYYDIASYSMGSRVTEPIAI